jgi:DNA topoisomerase-1
MGLLQKWNRRWMMIAVGEVDHIDYLKKFYKGKGGLKSKVDGQEKKIKPEESRTIELSTIDGKVEVKVGRYGPYVIVKDDKR